MGRQLHKLSPAAIRNAKRPGLYGDGAGLWLDVHERTDVSGKKLAPGKSWIFRFMLNGRARSMGLGALHTVSLAEARDRARAARQKLLDGVDPLDQREAARAAAALEAAKAITFKTAAEQFIEAHKAGWKNAKHAEQWPATLETYAYPIIGALPVQAIDTGLVLKVLEPIWTTKPETANRVRGRIENVLDWARVRGYRTGDNPARWKGHLDQTLPAKAKVRQAKHHAALPYAQIGDFVPALRAQNGTAARAMEFTILTAARTGEVIGARWNEIDLDEKLWVVPAERMKAGREHRVPLAPRAVEILKSLRPAKGEPKADAFVFGGDKPGMALSNMAMLALLKRMGRGDLTVHGFRSTFRDWAAERTSYPSEVAEMALAHTVSDKVEAAYRRGDMFQKRRRLAEAWASYCATPARNGTVTAIRGGDEL
jgi:integrase